MLYHDKCLGSLNMCRFSFSSGYIELLRVMETDLTLQMPWSSADYSHGLTLAGKFFES